MTLEQDSKRIKLEVDAEVCTTIGSLNLKTHGQNHEEAPYIEGTVVRVDPRMWSFEISHSSTYPVLINTSLYCAYNQELYIQPNDYVKLYNVEMRYNFSYNKNCGLKKEVKELIFLHKLSTIIVHTPKSTEQNERKIQYSIKLLNILRKYNPDDNFIFDLIKQIDTCKIKCQTEVATSVMHVEMIHFYLLCALHKIKKIPCLLTPSCTRPPNIRTDQNTPYFTISVQRSREACIVGFLYIDELGILSLKDDYGMIKCKVIGCNKLIRQYINSYIICQNFIFCTEKHKISPFSKSSQYCLFKLSSIRKIYVEKSLEKSMASTLIHETFPKNFTYKFKYMFVIIHVCAVNVRDDGKPECCIVVLIREKPQVTYIMLNENYISAAALMQPGHVYDVYSTKIIAGHFCPELKRIANCPVSAIGKILQNSAIFVRNYNSPSWPGNEVPGPVQHSSLAHINTLPELKKLLDGNANGSKNNMLISFVGVLQYKSTGRLDNYSRTKIKTQYPGFGTPDNKTLNLYFYDEDSNLKITMYLNNAERVQYNFGLIPYMKVLVKHAQMQRSKYLMMNYLTTITPLSYEPNIYYSAFSQAGLLMPPHMFYLSNGWSIADNSLVQAKPAAFLIKSVRIKPYVDCKTNRIHIEFGATFHTQDAMGEAVVSCKHLDLLQRILYLSDKEFYMWQFTYVRGLKELIEFRTDQGYALLDSVKPGYQTFYKVFVTMLLQYRRVPITNAVLICRKMHTERTANKGKPFYYLIGILDWYHPTFFRSLAHM